MKIYVCIQKLNRYEKEVKNITDAKIALSNI